MLPQRKRRESSGRVMLHLSPPHFHRPPDSYVEASFSSVLITPAGAAYNERRVIDVAKTYYIASLAEVATKPWGAQAVKRPQEKIRRCEADG
jgi:hypothetical protein